MFVNFFVFRSSRPAKSQAAIFVSAAVEWAIRSSRLEGSVKSHTRTWSVVAFLLVLVPAGWTQGAVTNVSNNPAVPVPGVGHDYIEGLNESVNPGDGTVNLSIPVTLPAGRGLTLPFTISYSSSNSSHMIPGSLNGKVLPYNDEDSAANYAWSANAGFLSSAGWTYLLPTLAAAGGLVPLGYASTDTGQIPDYCAYISSYVFRGPSGEGYPLHLSLAQQTEEGATGGNVPCSGPGGILYSYWYDLFPGGTATLNPQSELPSYFPNISGSGGLSSNPAPSSMDATIADPDGTIYSFLSTVPHSNGPPSAGIALPSNIEDRNGNKVTISDSYPYQCGSSGGLTYSCTGGVTLTDSLRRQALSISGFGLTTGDTVTVSGLTKPYIVTWSAPNPVAYSINMASLNTNLPASSYCGSDPNPVSTYLGFGPGISSIELPNQKSYTFTYDPTWGYLSTVTYPTGATVTYTYALTPTMSAADGYTDVYFQASSNGDTLNKNEETCAFRYDQAAVSSRTVSFDGVSTALVQAFTYQTNWATQATEDVWESWSSRKTTVTTTDNTVSPHVSYSTVYTYEPYSAAASPNDLASPIVQGASASALETEIQYYKDTNVSGTPLLTVTKSWYTSNELACEAHQLNTGQISATFYTWLAEGVLADKKEYDYGDLPSGFACNVTTPPTGFTPTRETVMNFQNLQPNPVFYQPNPNNTAMPTILDLPCSTIVSGNGVKVSEMDYLYDGGSSVCGAAGTPSVVPASVPTGTHDEANFSATSTSARGNLTMVTKQCFGCTSSSSSHTYDETGQVISTTDPRGYITNYSYNDNSTNNTICLEGAANPAGNSNAYITLITDALGHTQSFGYNYSTGETTCSTDANNQSTGYGYNDPLNRMKVTTYPDSGSLTLDYNDAVPSVTAVKLQTPNPTVTSVSTMDGLGHVIETQTSESNGADIVNTVFDGLGRVYSKTNPFLSSSQPSSSFVSTPTGSPLTKYFYDALSRPIETLEQDGTSTLQWCYNGVASSPVVYCNSTHLGSISNGTWVDSTDENGNHWQRTYDSFGRLAMAMEPSGTSPLPSLETDYGYDALNDLLSVNQNGNGGTDTARARSFRYDSLSRLTKSNNPESGVVTYSYDANGNLQTKTSPAVNSPLGSQATQTIGYCYDALNRVTYKFYAGSFSCASPTNYAGSYTYDTSGVSGALNDIGRLTDEKSYAGNTLVSDRQLFAYDAMGRLLNENEYTLANLSSGKPYSLAYFYDLAGNLVASTDGATPVQSSNTQFPCTLPSNAQSTVQSWTTLAFVNCFDSAGRTSSVTSNWAAYPTNMFTIGATNGYSPAGLLQNWGQGPVSGNPALNVTQIYDPRRLWMTSISATGQVP
ncbi:MAG: hypothetical protein WAL75_17560 [Terracidiphilus sp.]